MAKKQVKRWYVRRVAKFKIGHEPEWLWRSDQCVSITHEGLKALELAKKKG